MYLFQNSEQKRFFTEIIVIVSAALRITSVTEPDTWWERS